MAQEDLNIISAKASEYIWYCIYDDTTKNLQHLLLIEPGTTVIDNSKRPGSLGRYDTKDKDTFLDFLYQNKINIDNIEIPEELLDINEKAYINGQSILSFTLTKKLREW